MTAAPRDAHVPRTRPSRLCAACTAALAWTVAVAVAGTRTAPPAYATLLAGLGVVGAVVAAVEMRRTNRFEARLGAVVLASLVVVVQVLGAVVGGPSGAHAHWSAEAAAVVALGCTIPLLIALDARARARSAAPERPYAR
jgi:hypothetical protein